MTIRYGALERTSSFADFQRLLAGIRLADRRSSSFSRLAQEGSSMLGVDERRHAADFDTGDDVKGERGLTAGFRSEDFGYASARDAGAAEGNI